MNFDKSFGYQKLSYMKKAPIPISPSLYAKVLIYAYLKT